MRATWRWAIRWLLMSIALFGTLVTVSSAQVSRCPNYAIKEGQIGEAEITTHE